MSRRRAFALAALMGFVLAVAFISAFLAFKGLQRTTTIDRRLVTIEHPTPAQYRKQLYDALKRCAADPPCNRLFKATAPRGEKGATGDRGPRGYRGFRGRPGADGKTVKGPQGRPGRTVRGPQGAAGQDGKDATGSGATSNLVKGLDALGNRLDALTDRVNGLLAGLCAPALVKLLGLLGVCR